MTVVHYKVAKKVVMRSHCNGELDSKRCYIPGLTLFAHCPHCDHRNYRDLGKDHYLSDPKVGGSINELWSLCDQCEEEFCVKIKLHLSAEAVL